MKRLAIMAAACFMLLCSFCLAAAEEYTHEEIMSALRQAVAERGEFNTWSFEEKADFYNHYVYHNQGSRRGVPDDSCVDAATVTETARQCLQTYLKEENIEDDLSKYEINVDFWIECFMDQEREHELYSVCFFEKYSSPSADGHKGIGRYQLTVSPYSGEVLELFDIRKNVTKETTPEK